MKRSVVVRGFNTWESMLYTLSTMIKTALHNIVSFFIAQVLCFSAAGIGGAFTSTSVRTWYPEIAKPAWTPPSWVFGPVWTTLYAMMGIALWLVWRWGKWTETRGAVGLFLVQLALNALWSIVFFGMRNPGLAFGEILLLWCALVATIVAFWRHSKVASALLLPYLAWSSFAACLNFTIWRMN